MLGAGQLMTALNFVVAQNDIPQATAKNAEGLEKMARAAGKANSAVGQLAGAFTGMVAFNWIRQGFGAILKPAADLELSLKNLAVLTGANSEKLAEYREEAFRVASITPYGAQQMVDSLTKLAQVTGSAQSAMAALEPTTQLAMASFGKLSIEKSTKMVGEMTRGFGLAGEQIPLAAEKIASGTKAMGIQIQDVSSVMGRLSLAATRGGQSFDEILKTMLITKRVIPSQEMAATAISRVTSALADPKRRADLEAIGVTTLNAAGEIRPLSEVMIDLATRYQTGASSVRDAINKAFGERAVLPVIATIQQLTQGVRDNDGKVHKLGDAYAYLSTQLSGNSSVLKELSDAYKESTAGRIENMKNSIENLAISFGSMLAPAINTAASIITTLADILRTFSNLPGVSSILSSLLRFGGAVIGIWGVIAALDGFKRLITVINTNVLGAVGTTSIFSTRIALLRIQMAGATSAGTAMGYAFAFIRGTALSAATAVKGFLASMGPLGWVLMILSFLPEIFGAIKKVASAISGELEALAKLTFEFWREEATAFYDWFEKTWAGSAFGSMINDIKGGGAKGSITGFFSPQARIIAELQQQQERAAKKTAEIMREGGKQVYDYLQLGTKEMDKVVGELKGIIDYKPKAADWNVFRQLRTSVTGALKGGQLNPDQRKMAEGMDRASTRAQELALASQRRMLTPREHAELGTMLTALSAGATEMSLLNPKFISASLAKKFGKDTAKPILESLSGKGLDYAKILAQLRSGQFEVGSLSGFVPHLGETPTTEALINGTAKPDQLRSGLLPGKPEGFSGMDEAIKRSPEAMRWRRAKMPDLGWGAWKKAFQTPEAQAEHESQHVKKMADGIDALGKKMDGTLNVRVVGESRSDPLGSSSGSGLFSDIVGGILGGGGS